MADAFLARLPSLALGLIVFFLFYGASGLVSRLILRAIWESRRQKLPARCGEKRVALSALEKAAR